MMKRLALMTLFSLLLFGGLFGWKFFQIKQMVSAMKPPPPPVIAATEARTETWDAYLTAVGTLTAVASVDVSSEVPGKIKKLNFDSDQPVHAGQILVELDASTDLAELAGYEADMRLAEIKFARSRQLIGRHYIAEADFDLNKATLEQARAVVAAKKTLIAKKRIVAPFAGRLGLRKVNLGQYLSAGDSIVALQKLETVYADFSLPEQFLSRIQTGQVIFLSVSAYPDRQFNGRITAVNPGIDKATRSIGLRATLNNPEKLLHPGMFADVRLQLGESRQVVTLPDTAITYNPYGDSVFVIEDNKKGGGLLVNLKQVATGETREGRVEIVSGLNAGERVVSAGQVKLRNGMEVTVDKQAAPGERVSAP